ncbi:MAG: DUF504 domain-containing protein [Euryarchaeota archaeon]|nr:DUF504 domain-containing protein [Euryarchaeota archaeon]
MRRGTAKDVLARLRWKERLEDWSDVRVVILHRGAPNDEKAVAGSSITGLGASFFEVDGETQIPYHRIRRIHRGDALLYERPASSGKIS